MPSPTGPDSATLQVYGSTRTADWATRRACSGVSGRRAAAYCAANAARAACRAFMAGRRARRPRHGQRDDGGHGRGPGQREPRGPRLRTAPRRTCGEGYEHRRDQHRGIEQPDRGHTERPMRRESAAASGSAAAGHLRVQVVRGGGDSGRRGRGEDGPAQAYGPGVAQRDNDSTTTPAAAQIHHRCCCARSWSFRSAVAALTRIAAVPPVTAAMAATSQAKRRSRPGPAAAVARPAAARRPGAALTASAGQTLRARPYATQYRRSFGECREDRPPPYRPDAGERDQPGRHEREPREDRSLGAGRQRGQTDGEGDHAGDSAARAAPRRQRCARCSRLHHRIGSSDRSRRRPATRRRRARSRWRRRPPAATTVDGRRAGGPGGTATGRAWRARRHRPRWRIATPPHEYHRRVERRRQRA